jgi:type II secretion system protein C
MSLPPCSACQFSSRSRWPSRLLQVKPIAVAPIVRKARHFVEGAVLASASFLAVTGACPWAEEADERVQQEPAPRRAQPPERVVSEAAREPQPARDLPIPEATASVAAHAAMPIEPATQVPASTPPVYSEPAACAGPLRLTGSIVVAGQPQHSLAAVSKGAGTSLLHVGQRFDGLELAALLPRRAYMRQASGAYCTLHLLPSAQPAPRKADRPRAKRAKPAPPFTQQELSAAIRTAGSDRFVVSRAFASQALSKLAGVRGLGRFAPSMRDGRAMGMRVHGVKRESPLHRLGIRNGDVLRTLNGISLSGLDGFLRAAPLLKTERTLSLALLRRGQPHTLEYALE